MVFTHTRPRMVPLVLIGLGVALVLGACSSDRGTDPEPAPPETTIGIDGGTLSASSVDTEARLELPAGAVLDDVAIRLVAETPEEGQRARFRLEPAGLFLQADATLTLTLPAGEDASRWTPMLLRGEDAIPLDADVEGNEIVVSLRMLGLSGPATGRAPGSSLGLMELDCDLQLESLHDRLLRLQAWSTALGGPSLLAEEVVVLRQQVAVLRETCTLEPEYAAEIELLNLVSCQMYEDGSVDAKATLAPSSVDAFDSQMAEVFAGRAMVAMSAGECGPDFASLLASESRDFIDAWDARLSEPGYLDGLGTWTAMWAELRQAALGLGSRLAAMGLTAQETQLEEQLLSHMYEVLHRVAFDACGDDHTQAYLADLLTGGFYRDHPVNASPQPPDWSPVGADAFRADIQYCASRLQVDAFDAVSEPVDSRPLGAGDGPGVHTSSAGIEVPADGFLELRGPSYAFFCSPAGGIPSFANDRLTLTIDGQEIEAFVPEAGAMLTSPLSISVEQLLDQLGRSPEVEHTLTAVIVRESPACNGAYGEPSYDLFQLSITTEPVCAGGCRTLVVHVELPESVNPGDTVEIEGEAYYEYVDGAEIPAGSDVTIELTAEGGTVSPATPTVVDGRFTATATPGSGGWFEVRADASDTDGLTASDTDGAIICPCRGIGGR